MARDLMSASYVLADQLRMLLGARAAHEERRGHAEIVEHLEIAGRQLVGAVVERQRDSLHRRGPAPQQARESIEHRVLDKSAYRREHVSS